MIPAGWQLLFHNEKQTLDYRLDLDPDDAKTYWQHNLSKYAFTDPIQLLGDEKGPFKGGWVDTETQEMRCMSMPQDWNDQTKSVLLCLVDCPREDVYCCL